MSPKAAIGAGYSNALKLSGRAGRAEFWWFFAFVLVLSMAVEFGYGLIEELLYEAGLDAVAISADYLLLALALIFIWIPLFTLTIRRFHDRGLSGWWVIALEFGILILPTILGFVLLTYFKGVFAVDLTNSLSGQGPPARLDYAMFAAQAAGVLLILVQLIICALPSQKGPNRFGPPPEGTE